MAGTNGTPGTVNGNVAEFFGCLIIYIKEATIGKPKIQQRRIAQASARPKYE